MAPKIDGCSGYRRASRRDLLKVGALSFVGLSTADLLRARAAAAAETRGAADMNCIVLWLNGGPPAMDMWDMKPDAPAETRGEFTPIKTNVPGIEICEHLPLVARQMDKIALVRSLYHGFGCHTTGPTMMQSGFDPLRRDGDRGLIAPGNYPGYGSVMAAVRGRRGLLPAHICIPSAPNGAGPGYMGGRMVPYEVMDDPNSASFTVRDLTLPRGVTPDRLDRRRALLNAVDGYFRSMESEGEFRNVDRFRQEAYDITLSAGARSAFDLKAEPAALRDAYGRTKIGQSCLLARRLVEAGVRCVTVNDDGWDTHDQNFTQLKDRLLPGLDKAFGTLIRDLHERGLLERTLVLCMGEFSRTPVINPMAGRDHWSFCISVALAGGGVRGGTVVGASDRVGGYPTDEPMHVSRLAATVYHLLGISPETQLHDMAGRPMPLLPKPAAPIAAIV